MLYVNSDLLDHCVASLNYGAINDLFSSILVVSPDFQYRQAVKDVSIMAKVCNFMLQSNWNLVTTFTTLLVLLNL